MPESAVVDSPGPAARTRRPLRAAVQAVFLCIAAAGLVVLLLPRPDGSSVSVGHHHTGSALPTSQGPAASGPSLRLGFDPVALTSELTSAVQRDLNRQDVLGGSTAKDAQLLYRGSSSTITTAGISACVVPLRHPSRARQWTFDLRLDGQDWRVVRRAAAVTYGC